MAPAATRGPNQPEPSGSPTPAGSNSVVVLVVRVPARGTVVHPFEAALATDRALTHRAAPRSGCSASSPGTTSSSVQARTISTTRGPRCDAIEARFGALQSAISHEIRTGLAEMRVSTITWAVGAVISVAGVGAGIGGLVLQLGERAPRRQRTAAATPAHPAGACSAAPTMPASF